LIDMPNHNTKSNIAAFFDFDETLLAIDSAGVGFKLLKKEGYISNFFMLKMIIVMLLLKIGLIDEEVLARAMLRFYKGRTLQPFIDSADAFYLEYLKPNLSPNVLERLKWHQQEGHQTVLVTGSIDYYLEPVMKDLGLDHLLCTHLEMGADGLLTGRSDGPVCVGNNKVTLSAKLANAEGIDLAHSYAYGNSHLDIPIMEKVEHAFMVNPSSRLARFGKRMGWALL